MNHITTEHFKTEDHDTNILHCDDLATLEASSYVEKVVIILLQKLYAADCHLQMEEAFYSDSKTASDLQIARNYQQSLQSECLSLAKSDWEL